ncbi:hypothetical protein F4803DRAFT_529841 [Xylaria telfairii]|nr:hypothetical protein F4803DRAFT_529841 [Xylaria telfairii]
MHGWIWLVCQSTWLQADWSVEDFGNWGVREPRDTSRCVGCVWLCRSTMKDGLIVHSAPAPIIKADKARCRQSYETCSEALGGERLQQRPY